MKKLLAILLALMLVLVSVTALADGDGLGGNDTPAAGDGTDTPAGGDGTDTPSDGGDSGTTAKTPEDYLPNPEDKYSNTEKIDENNTLANEPNVSVTLSKKVNVVGYKEKEDDDEAGTGKAPAQHIEFVVGQGQVSNNTIEVAQAEIPQVTISALDFAKEDTEETVTITIPSAFPAIGIYTYAVTENVYDKDGDDKVENVAGVTPASNLLLTITVVQQEDGPAIAGVSLRQNNVKTDEIENLYEAGALDITKTVDGNMGDKTATWTFTVELTSDVQVMSDIKVNSSESTGSMKINGSTATVIEGNGWKNKTVIVNLTHGQKLELDNIPAGVTYTVTETENSDYDECIKEGDSGTIESGKKASAKFTNKWNIIPDTGVALDSAVYMLILALVLAGIVVLKVRRREDY